MYSCVEEIPLETESFESILVVEATLTNEEKYQEVLLTRTYKLVEEEPSPESGASVFIFDEAMNTYAFHEATSGKYISDISFSAASNTNYTLAITTDSGGSYESSAMQLTQNTQIDNLYVERGINEDGLEGVSIFVDSFDPTGNSKYYRHEYEETYKIIAPLYDPEELISNGVEFPILMADIPYFDNLQEIIDFLVTRRLREEQEQICYNTIVSNHLILTHTNDLVEDKLEKYRIRFIERSSPEIIHRYSILVRQYVQSRAAYSFYETLNSFSESESVLSENQPGFIEGNLYSKSDSQEKVIGFFEVVSVDSKRLFFNYEELFPDEDLPPYFVTCDEFFTPALIEEDFAHNWIGSPLVDAVNEGFQFYDESEDENNSPFLFSPYRLVLSVCGDCTYLGDNSIPDFWEE